MATNPIAALLSGAEAPLSMSSMRGIPDPAFSAPRVAAPKKSGFDNILGFLGDFLTSRLGMGTPYKDARDNNKLYEAMQPQNIGGPDENPEQMFDRVSQVNVPMGVRLREQYIDNQRQAGQAANTAEATAARIAAQRDAKIDRQRRTVGAVIESLTRTPDKNRNAAYSSWYSRLQKQGYEPEVLEELPEKFDPERLDIIADSLVPVGMQRSQRLAAQSLGVRADDVRQDNRRADENLDERRRSNKVREGQGDERGRLAHRRQDWAENPDNPRNKFKGKYTPAIPSALPPGMTPPPGYKLGRKIN